MSKENGHTLQEVQAVARDLLRHAASQEMAESDLFPYGVNHVSVTVRAGDVEISMHMAGPDHAHGDEEMDWPQDDLFDDDGEVP